MALMLTKDEVKAYLKLDSTDTSEDSMILTFISAAQEEMQADHGRQLEYRSRTEPINGPGDTLLFLQAFPIAEVASVKVNGQTLRDSEYEVDQARGMLKGHWPTGVRNIEVIYKGGYWFDLTTPPPAGENPPILPSDLKLEALEKVAAMYENRRGQR